MIKVIRICSESSHVSESYDISNSDFNNIVINKFPMSYKQTDKLINFSLN